MIQAVLLSIERLLYVIVHVERVDRIFECALGSLGDVLYVLDLVFQRLAIAGDGRSRPRLRLG